MLTKKGLLGSVALIVIILLVIGFIVLELLGITHVFSGKPGAVGISAEIYPSKAVIGTIFKIKATVGDYETVDSVMAIINREMVVLYDDGSHGDGKKSDGVYGGAWNSNSSKNTGVITGAILAQTKDNRSFESTFSFELTKEACNSLLINGNPEDKIDITIMGQGYASLEDFRADALQYIDLNAKHDGLFSYSPFKEELSRFNIYTIDTLFTNNNLKCELNCKGVASIVCCNDEEVSRAASECPSDQIIILINEKNFCGSSSSYVKVCTKGNTNSPMVLVHEFGHSFGGLGDEYDYGIYPGMEKITNYNFPNCVSDCADWPKNLDLGCFKTCGYTDYYRSSENSIMRSYVNTFEAFNTYYLNSLFASYKPETKPEAEVENISNASSLPAMQFYKEKQFISTIIYKKEKLSFDNVYVAPGVAPDRKTVKEGYEARIISCDNNLLYSSKFYIPQIIFPFYEKGSEQRPPAISAPEGVFTLQAPFFSEACKIQIYDKGTLLFQFDVGYFSKLPPAPQAPQSILSLLNISLPAPPAPPATPPVS